MASSENPPWLTKTNFIRFPLSFYTSLPSAKEIGKCCFDVERIIIRRKCGVKGYDYLLKWRGNIQSSSIQ